MIRRITILLLLLATDSAMAQETWTLQGKITNEKNGRPLSGAAVYCKERSNLRNDLRHGRPIIKLSLPNGKCTVVCTYLGYESCELIVNMNGDKQQDMQLKESVQKLDDVIVSSFSAARQGFGTADRRAKNRCGRDGEDTRTVR